FNAMTFRQELLLGRAGVHENDVGVAAAGDVERLSRPEGDNMDLHARGALVDRQQIAEEPRLLGGRGRRDGDEFLLRARDRSEREERQDEKTSARDYHGNSPSRNCAASLEAGRLKNCSALARSTRRP